MHRWFVLKNFCFVLLVIIVFAAVRVAASDPIPNDHDHLLVNCGSASATSAAAGGREWLGDTYLKFSSSVTSSSTTVTRVTGSSTKSTADAADTSQLIPYQTARISHSQFSYIFPVSPGQKFIRLHFHSASYGKNGFERFNDLFTVEAGPFTLMSNFSASLTANALGVTTFVKEFCITIAEYENQPLNITFTPAPAVSVTSQVLKHAFVNGIEIISLPAGLPYCHSGDVGVKVVGHKSLVYIDNTTALEMFHRQNVKRDYITLSGDDFRGLFGLKKAKAKNKLNNITWKVPVDVGFRYLVRLHFCELGLEMAEAGHKSFELLINHMIADTSADIRLKESEEHKGISALWYRNYMVMVQGRKREGKRDILISLHSKNELIFRHFPVEGFEIFKLSNHDNSLASPNPSPPPPDSPSSIIQNLVSRLGLRNAIATVFVIITCFLNIILHKLRPNWATEFTDEETKPSTRAKRLCRHFSVVEIRSATKNFSDGLVIGKGGFGKVYKALIDNGLEAVAIKRLKLNSKQGEREFWTEIEMLSELRHVNLVPLIGYCNEQREMILAYEYQSNGTLADHLYRLARKSINCSPLSWEQRLKICIGAGRGLDYLHTGHGVVHRDVKASNILLDDNFVAKVSDFGLAKALNGSELQSQASTNLKGTFGYFDPDYFRTRKLTMKSDTYSFGVVLLEVLCGRPAVDPWVEEDKRSLSMWATDNISKGRVDEIVDPSVRGEISPDSLKSFVGLVERCLHDDPKKRPLISHVVINLEFALEQQENAKCVVPNVKTSSIADVLPCIDKTTTEALLPDEVTTAADPPPATDKTISSLRLGQFSTSSLTSTKIVHAAESPYGKEHGRKSAIHKLSRRVWPWDALWNRAKPSKRKDFAAGTSISAPIFDRVKNKTVSGSNVSMKTMLGSSTSPKRKSSAAGGGNKLVSFPNLRIFSFSELKVATRNFRADAVVGQGGFGTVYRGYLKEKSTTQNGTRTMIAVKKLNPESTQGFEEWQSEVNFLGGLSHPNLVKLLGYCWEDKELLLVYEFMQRGSLENHLFGRSPTHVQPLPWDIRLKILIGAARGLAFLHEFKVIYRDFKTSNILLDESYHTKLSDFGLAKLGPTEAISHVTTRVMGTYGYAAPEYIATGHLYVKSDMYGFGVILIEMLTGLRALDIRRPSGQQNLVDWIKPQLTNRRKLKNIMDSRLEGRYPSISAFQLTKLALNCLENNPKDRPEAQQVVETLERIEELSEEKPPRVRFS